ncbi:hydroxyacid dehydrogenase [Ruficoccus sp. ZRK36]|uniref:hydroxyacid dehydrogenase n=1 Tax=Ruficoccus sp. ZRK36 TaxID=2866311 RepID=UPI001C7350DC|nr:hydroxyacid dehydrogenase [Ruficoccus sp. ZRK36]QYY37236.1 hydroxyacid dehydrogenase [Ruficoccus sp. ZRK36]
MLLTPREYEDHFPDGLNDLKKRVSEFVWCQEPSGVNWKDFLESTRCEILLVGRSMPALPPIQELAPPSELKYICYLAGTVRTRIPLDWIESGIQVTNWGPSISRVVAECALMMILATLRNAASHQYLLHHRQGWKSQHNKERLERSLFGRTVGIHGFGNVAQSLVELLKPFGCNIQTYTPFIPDGNWNGIHFCQSVEELFETSEILVEAAPLNAQTQFLVGRKLLERLPNGACFINVGRGKVVREDDLIEVAAGKNLRLGLDVYHQEPLPADSPLRSDPNVFLMPHQAGPTQDRLKDIGAYALRQIFHYLEGQPLDNVITPEVWKITT